MSDEEEIMIEGYPQVSFQVINDENGQGCAFTLKDFNLRDVSQLRRIFYSSLKVMAIELIEIIENTTDFVDEMIATRLGMVPIRCEGVEDIPMIENTENIEDEIEEGIDFEIDVDEPPKNKGGQRRYITEDDIIIDDPRCKTITKGTPIFFLRPGQRFELIGEIQKGTGSMHAKWIPVASVTYESVNEREYILKINTTGQLTCDEIIKEALKILNEEEEEIEEEEETKEETEEEETEEEEIEEEEETEEEETEEEEIEEETEEEETEEEEIEEEEETEEEIEEETEE